MGKSKSHSDLGAENHARRDRKESDTGEKEMR